MGKAARKERLPQPWGLKVLTVEDGLRIRALPFGEELLAAWDRVLKIGDAAAADLGKLDRYWLLIEPCKRTDLWHPWIYARCREVEAEPDGVLDLWAREHGKSSMITFGGSVQEIVRDSDITIGIFSHTKPEARKFLSWVKLELEDNRVLQGLYPDVLYADPQKEAPRWSEEKGIIVRRKSNPREATIEAHGLVDGQPTGSHFKLRIYDDIVTLESVTTAEQIKKTTEAHALSDNLGARGADGKKRAWHLGTRYRFGDTYQDLIDRKALKTRIYPATDDGTPTGNPVYLTKEQWADVRRKQPTAILAAQQLLNPAAGVEAMFQQSWLRFTDIRPATLNVYLCCDPASSRKKNSDDTVITVMGIDANRNKYLLDGYAHKMGLSERWQKIRDLWKKWSESPGVQFVKVGYERYGLLDAMEHFEERQEVEKLSFEIAELAWPTEGANSKYDRIQRLEPDFRAGKWFLAAEPIDKEGRPIEETRNQRELREMGQDFRAMRPIWRKDAEGNAYSLNGKILVCYLRYPYVVRDDTLDCMSRIYDMDPAPPIVIDAQLLEPETFVDGA
jgi:hypothetical protein